MWEYQLADFLPLSIHKTIKCNSVDGSWVVLLWNGISNGTALKLLWEWFLIWSEFAGVWMPGFGFWVPCSLGVIRRIMVPKDILIWTPKYVTLHGKRDFADVTKDFDGEMILWTNHRDAYEREAGRAEPEVWGWGWGTNQVTGVRGL